MGELKIKILKIFSNYFDDGDMIHCFLYFLGGGSKRTLDNDEIDLITFINTQQKIYFPIQKYFLLLILLIRQMITMKIHIKICFIVIW